MTCQLQREKPALDLGFDNHLHVLWLIAVKQSIVRVILFFRQYPSSAISILPFRFTNT